MLVHPELESIPVPDRPRPLLPSGALPRASLAGGDCPEDEQDLADDLAVFDAVERDGGLALSKLLRQQVDLDLPQRVLVVSSHT